MNKSATTEINPFRFGALALDESFADREGEIAELSADIRNGLDVVVFAPRRCGKSSLVWRVAEELRADDVLVAQVDVMATPTKKALAGALTKSIYDEVASTVERVGAKALAPFKKLRVRPEVRVDPESGSYTFRYDVAQREEDMDATIASLLRLLLELGAARGRRVALVMDEFQEIVEIDPNLPNLMRSVFQEQPEVAHVYLGSKRHVLERIFSDVHEPFWRSAKSIELGPIPAGPFARFVSERFHSTGRAVDAGTIGELLAITGGHPYATQELAYFLWEQSRDGKAASPEDLGHALEAVLRSEHAHFTLLWEGASPVQKVVLSALAQEPGRPFTGAYRTRHDLPPTTNVQKALRALEKRELVAGADGAYRIVEPFLAEWLKANLDER